MTVMDPDEEARLRKRAITSRPFSPLYRDLCRVFDLLDAERAGAGRLREAADEVCRYEREHPVSGGLATRIGALFAALDAEPGQPR